MSAPRGRPRDPSVDARALAAAREVVGRQGLNLGASMSAIAATAGVGKPALYLRWTDLDDLIGAALSDLEPTLDRRQSVGELVAAFDALEEDGVGGFLVALAADPTWRGALRKWAER